MQPPSAPASASERSRDRRSASAVGRFSPVARRSKIPKKRTFAYFTLPFAFLCAFAFLW